MKKHVRIIFATIIFLAESVPVKAQGYYPMLDSISNNWTFVINLVPLRLQQSAIPCDYSNIFISTAAEIYTTGDTLIGTETYKKLQFEDFFGFMNCEFGYLREDTASQKIYFADNLSSPEILLYDFSMTPGDSINLNFVNGGFYYSNGFYYLDSIVNISINAGIRRLFYLSNPNNFTQYPLEWIESVGHPGHLVYTHSLNIPGGGLFNCTDPIARDFYQLLTCFEHNSQKVYFDSCAHAMAYNNGCFDYTDSCNYWNICGALDEQSPIAEWTLAPNPASDQVQIKVAALRDEHVILSVIDPKGGLISQRALNLKTGMNALDFEVYSCNSGFYVLEMRWKDGVLYRKLVVAQGY